MQIEESLMKSSTALARLSREMQNEEETHPRMLAQIVISSAPASERKKAPGFFPAWNNSPRGWRPCDVAGDEERDSFEEGVPWTTKRAWRT